MKELSETEAKTIAMLLGSGLETQREAMQRARLSRSTFTAARRKAFSEGWVFERGVPSAAAGFKEVSFVVARPFAEFFSRIGDVMGETEGAVVVWQSVDLVFGVFLSQELGVGNRLATRIHKEGLAQAVSAWDVEPDSRYIPVYFDYEGVFSHITGVPSVLYPRPFPTVESKILEEGPSRPFLEKEGEIARRAFRGDAVSGGLRRFGTAGFPRSWRRIIERGFMDWRVLPDFSKILPYNGTSLSRIALIHGELREGSTPAGLFAELVGSSRVYPFLYTADDTTVLIGAMGRGPPAAVSLGEQRSPVFPTVQRHLSGVTVVNTDIHRLEVRLDHRYEQLFT